jgi:hypothetical protein
MIKPILYMVFMLVLVFLCSSGVSVQFKPFHVSFSHPVFGVGIVLIAIGMALCCGNTYYKGMKENGYSDGYKKGFDSGVDYVIDWAKKKKEADNETKKS